MESRLRLPCLTSVVATAFLILLTGCAHKEVAESDQTMPTSQVSAPAEPARVSERIEPAKTADSQPNYEVMNPVPIAFDKLSVKLDEANKQILAKLVERVKSAKKITITSHCDRKQVGNAKEAAIARGIAIKRELVQLGGKASSIRIKYSTEVSGKHVAEIHFT